MMKTHESKTKRNEEKENEEFKSNLLLMEWSVNHVCYHLISTLVCCKQRWHQGRNAGGAKTVRVPTASEASKIFTGHTFQICLKCDYTL